MSSSCSHAWKLGPSRRNGPNSRSRNWRNIMLRQTRSTIGINQCPSAMPDPKPEPQPRRAGPPHNPGLRKLIEGKRKWHRPERTLPLPPEGGVPSASGTLASAGSNTGTPTSHASTFLGWHERGYLPHFDAPYVTQFVTFMLHDAFPVTRRREWEGILNESDDSQRRRKLEAWLDRGHGECWLRRADGGGGRREIARGW